MDQALYRKYRSKSFNDVVGQDHITKTLQKAISSGRVSHAYLFTGPRGVGKTSVARILAHEVNQLPYQKESIHLDIIEIDAASNRRIDEIRDLRDRVKIAPAAGKYKVYIIDEVHMLTREAFNALLKTLEEPPAHCIFILATTEAHKLPETIISRTQRFEFKPISDNILAEHLIKIAAKESIDITPEAIGLLAKFGNGSFRDSISYLDQLSSLEKLITDEDVRQILGMPTDTEISALIDAMKKGDLKSVVYILQSIKGSGVSAASLAGSLARKIRESILNGSFDRALAVLLKQLIEVPASSQPYDMLEISLLEASAKYQTDPIVIEKAESLPSNKIKTRRSKTVLTRIEPERSTSKPADNIIRHKKLIENWDEVLESAKSQNASIYTALRLAEHELDNGTLILKFQFPLHQKKIEQPKNKYFISSLIEEVTGEEVNIISVVEKRASKPSDENDFLHDEKVSNTKVSPITNIFGATEMLD
jgi:DNA polymerase-3 subunit gamma/tau